MLKRVLCIWLLLAIVLVLTSCGGSPAKDPLIGKWRHTQTYSNGTSTSVMEFKENGTCTVTKIDEYGSIDVETAKWHTIDNTLILTTGSFTERTESCTYSISRNQLTSISNGNTMIWTKE